MLRRKPTAITLTTEDIAIYEDARAREQQIHDHAELQARLQAQQQQQQQQQQLGTPNRSQNLRDPSDELRPLPNDRARAAGLIKTREERLGLVPGGGGGSSRS